MTEPFRAVEVSATLAEEIRLIHIGLARDELAALRRSDPAWQGRFQQFVDGRLGRPIASVRQFGRIDFATEQLREVIEFVWRSLNRRAEKISTEKREYIRSFRIFVRGVGSFTRLEDVPFGVQQVDFLPLVPYAQKIERGQSRGAKAGVFRPTARAARAKFGRSARIGYSQTVPRGDEADGAGNSARIRTNQTRGRARRRQTLERVPVPVIRVRQGAFFSGGGT